jgi:hypothetical protein
MKIIKRDLHKSLTSSAALFVIPALTYVFLKSQGTIIPGREFLWWITIGLTFITWIIINFKLTKKN